MSSKIDKIDNTGGNKKFLINTNNVYDLEEFDTSLVD